MTSVRPANALARTVENERAARRAHRTLYPTEQAARFRIGSREAIGRHRRVHRRARRACGAAVRRPARRVRALAALDRGPATLSRESGGSERAEAASSAGERSFDVARRQALCPADHLPKVALRRLDARQCAIASVELDELQPGFPATVR